MSEEVIQDQATVTVCGTKLVKHPFTNREADEWARISDERGVEEANKRIIALSSERQNLSNKRIDLQQKAVEALEAKLDKEYERDEWDAAKIASLTTRILEENEKLRELENGDGQRLAEASFEIADRLDAAQAVVQEAHLEMAHYLAGKPGKFSEWLETAVLEDYQGAREIVQAGLVPFARRRTRAARGGRGTH